MPVAKDFGFFPLMVQARTEASIVGRLQNFVASAVAFRLAANYRGCGDRCLTIKSDYAISIADHPYSKFGEKG
jgi:hypothetical protein